MDAKAVCNYGLAKVGSSRVNSLAPASSKLEKNCAQFYPQWRDSELTKRRWVFATFIRPLDLNPSADVPAPFTHGFDAPSNMLRPIRDRASTWRQSGKIFLTYGETFSLEYVARVPETDFDPLFLDVLGCRVVLENLEYLTQSNTKMADAKDSYKEAVRVAGANNAFIIGPEESVSADELDTWELARFGAWP